MNYTEKNKLIDKLCGAVLMFMLVEIFYSIVDASYTTFGYNYDTIQMVVNICGGVFLAISLVILIMSYKKDDSFLASYGIEMLTLAMTAPILHGTYVSFPFPYNKLNILFPLIFGTYYFSKILYIISKKNISNSIYVMIIGLIYFGILIFDGLAMKETIFIIMAIIAAIMCVHAMIKKSKFILTHALEFMIASFLVLLATSYDAIVFFAVAIAIYYLAKSIFVIGNTKKKKRKK